MRIFTLAAFLVAFMFTPALAGPDCSNVDPTARMAGCNGFPDFAVDKSPYKSGRAEDDRKQGYSQPVKDDEPEPDPDPDPDPDPEV